jgi:Terminase RNaseH-like domain
MKSAVMVSWSDVPHLSEDQKKSILAGIPAWQRDARTKGVPQLGAGAIYQVPEADIRVVPFAIPKHWRRGYGMDVGWNRTAVCFFAIDPDTDTVYVYDEYYRGNQEPSVHAHAIQARGKWLPGVIDPAARGRSQKDGEKLLDQYQDLGLDVEIAINAREAGIYAVWERLSQGRLKVFATCSNFFAEYRLYRRDEKGNIVKTLDHLMDATRYYIMSGIDRSIVEPVVNNGKRWCDWNPGIWAS